MFYEGISHASSRVFVRHGGAVPNQGHAAGPCQCRLGVGARVRTREFLNFLRQPWLRRWMDAVGALVDWGGRVKRHAVDVVDKLEVGVHLFLHFLGATRSEGRASPACLPVWGANGGEGHDYVKISRLASVAAARWRLIGRSRTRVMA